MLVLLVGECLKRKMTEYPAPLAGCWILEEAQIRRYVNRGDIKLI
jgi:hypothetical protein